MTHIDTVVIGAGIAGLAAARLIAGAGRRVVVLEARDRVGGRVHSDRSDGAVTDLGASWIHGIADEPVWDAVRAFGMPTVEFTVGSYQPDGRAMAQFGPDGERWSDERAAAFAADVRTLEEALRPVIAASTDASYAEAVDEALAALGWEPDRAALVREYAEHRTEEQYGAWIDDMAAHGLDDDTIEGDEVIFPDGYDALATHLAEGLDIRLGQTVPRVRWGEGGVDVETLDGGVLAADSAVLTVPVGVLRAGGVTIEPPLPAAVARALSNLEMNAFEKIVLRFDEAFWDEGVYAIRQHGPEGAWWHSWYDLTRLSGTPTLLTFAAGPAARATRGWSDEEVVASIMTQLRRLYGPGVPEPAAVRRTAWQDDPLSHGSYAYLRVGGDPADHERLAEPIGGVLHIAGEATWTPDPATVPGAFHSGHRAAERVLGRSVPIAQLWSPSTPAGMSEGSPTLGT